MHVIAVFSRSAVRACLSTSAVFCLAAAVFAREPDFVLPLWTGIPPGESAAKGGEHRVGGRPRPFYQITDIAVPSLEVFQPPKAKRLGTAVLVCPGGGLQRLAYEHEGLEVAEWLNSLGLTAAVLKYRTPAPARTAAMDAQRALSLIRSHAGEWELDPAAIGVLGFSAGGEIAAWLCTHHDERLYPAAEAADQASCRPDFAALVYPGGLLQSNGTLREPVGGRIRAGLPPVFLAHAGDDGPAQSLALALALQRAGVPTELHLYREGGHGFGVRTSGIPTGGWKNRLAEWLASLGFLDSWAARDLARRTGAALTTGRPPPRFTEAIPGGSLADAYVVQRRLVRARAAGDPVAGFKAAAASAAAQSALGLDGPLAGVLFQSGRLDGREFQRVPLRKDESVVVETEIGYITSVDLSGEILTDEQARGAVEWVVPIIELPRSYPDAGPPEARNMVAANVGSDRFIVGPPVQAERFDPDAVAVRLTRDGQLIHETTGASVAGGQWANLRRVLNLLTRAGYTIPARSVILGGALGTIQPGAPGRYEASFAGLGTVSFELR